MIFSKIKTSGHPGFMMFRADIKTLLEYSEPAAKSNLAIFPVLVSKFCDGEIVNPLKIVSRQGRGIYFVYFGNMLALAGWNFCYVYRADTLKDSGSIGTCSFA